MLSKRQRSGGIDRAFYFAVDAQLVQEFDHAFDRNSARENSAGWRWHDRAVRLAGNDSWSGLLVRTDCGFSRSGVNSLIPPSHSEISFSLLMLMICAERS